MSEIYRKWGRVARWDHGVLVRVDEAGESRESVGEFRVEPMLTRGAPETVPHPDAEAVQRTAEEIVAMVEPPLERFRRDYHPLQFSATRTDGRLQHLINREFARTEPRCQGWARTC